MASRAVELLDDSVSPNHGSDSDVQVVEAPQSHQQQQQRRRRRQQQQQHPQRAHVIAINCGQHGVCVCAISADLQRKWQERPYVVSGFELLQASGYKGDSRAATLPSMISSSQLLQRVFSQQPDAYVVLQRCVSPLGANEYMMEALQRKADNMDIIADTIKQHHPQAQLLDMQIGSTNTAAKAFTATDPRAAAREKVAGGSAAALAAAATLFTNTNSKARRVAKDSTVDAAMTFLASSSCSMADLSDPCQQLQGFNSRVDNLRDMAAAFWMAMYVLRENPSKLIQKAVKQGRAPPGTQTAADAAAAAAAAAAATAAAPPPQTPAPRPRVPAAAAAAGGGGSASPAAVGSASLQPSRKRRTKAESLAEPHTTQDFTAAGEALHATALASPIGQLHRAVPVAPNTPLQPQRVFEQPHLKPEKRRRLLDYGPAIMISSDYQVQGRGDTTQPAQAAAAEGAAAAGGGAATSPAEVIDLIGD